MGNSPPKRAAAVRELDRFTGPTGLYPSCPWDQRMSRRLILEKKIAPRFPGRESKESCFTQECPICFMYYPGNLNSTTCCKKSICTECYLQLHPPRKTVSCPFCNHSGFSIKYVAPAVINLSSIYTDKTYSSHAETEASGLSVASASSTVSQHFASVEDRNQLRDDLRSQLNLTDRPLTTPVERPSQSQLSHPPTTTSFVISSVEDVARLADPRYFIASATDAERLEEIMLLEAIHRSMRDLDVGKDTDEEEEEEEKIAENCEYAYEDNDDDDSIDEAGLVAGEFDTLRPPQADFQDAEAGGQRPYSSSFNDDSVVEPVDGTGASVARQGPRTRWQASSSNF